MALYIGNQRITPIMLVTPNLATVAYSGDYDDLTDKPDLSGFINNAVNDLVNYYTKSDTYTKTEVNNLIAAISTVSLEVVNSLPTQDISTTTIYLVPKTTAETNNVYDEYVYISNTWELIGSTEVDLTNYYTKTEINNKFIKLTQAEYDLLTPDSSTYYFIEEE